MMSNLMEDIVRELDKIVDVELASYYSSARTEMRDHIEERVYGEFAYFLVEMYRNKDEIDSTVNEGGNE